MRLRHKFNLKNQVIVQKNLRFFERANNDDQKVYR